MNETLNPFTKMLSEYSAAVFEKNVGKYVSLYSDNVLIFDMWNDWYVQGLQQWRKMTEDWFASLDSEKVNVASTEIQFQQFGETIVGCAILRYAASDVEGLEIRHLNTRVSINMRNVDGEWKIFHQHSSAPIDGKSIQVKFNLDDA